MTGRLSPLDGIFFWMTEDVCAPRPAGRKSDAPAATPALSSSRRVSSMIDGALDPRATALLQRLQLLAHLVRAHLRAVERMGLLEELRILERADDDGIEPRLEREPRDDFHRLLIVAGDGNSKPR